MWEVKRTSCSLFCSRALDEKEDGCVTGVLLLGEEGAVSHRWSFFMVLFHWSIWLACFETIFFYSQFAPRHPVCWWWMGHGELLPLHCWLCLATVPLFHVWFGCVARVGALLVLPRQWTQFWLYGRRMREVEYQTCLWCVWMCLCVCSRLYRTVIQRQTVAKFPVPALLLLCPPQSRQKWRSPNHCKPLSIWVCVGAWACKGWFCRFKLRKGLHMRGNFEMCTYLW